MEKNKKRLSYTPIALKKQPSNTLQSQVDNSGKEKSGAEDSALK
jgi:hypothetical protein